MIRRQTWCPGKHSRIADYVLHQSQDLRQQSLQSLEQPPRVPGKSTLGFNNLHRTLGQWNLAISNQKHAGEPRLFRTWQSFEAQQSKLVTFERSSLFFDWQGSTSSKKVNRKWKAAWRSSSRLDASRSATPSDTPACKNASEDTSFRHTMCSLSCLAIYVSLPATCESATQVTWQVQVISARDAYLDG